MVKGTTRRVVVIKSPDPRIFDEAIFIVKEDAVRKGVDSSQILREAQSAAQSYITSQKSSRKRFLDRIPPYGFAAIGAGVTTLIWILSSVIF